MFGLLISFLTFAAVFLGIFTVNLVLTDLFKTEKRKRLQQQEEEIRLDIRQRAKESLQSDAELARLAMEASEQPYFSLVDFVKQFKLMMTQAGMRTSIPGAFLVSFVCFLPFSLLMYWLTRMPAVSVLVLALFPLFPVLYVANKRRQRLEKMRAQLPDALDLISRVLRAGQTITQGMNAVGDEFKPPVGEEFGYCYEQQNLGLSTEVALRQLGERTGLMEIKIFIMAIMIQRQSGGNLAELLDKLAKVIRQRFEMRGMIKSLTAEGRLQATILLGLPFAVWFLLLIVNRTYALKLLDHPTLIVSTLVVMALGAVWIKKIVNFDF